MSKSLDVISTIHNVFKYGKYYNENDFLEVMPDLIEASKDIYFTKDLQNYFQDIRKELGYCPNCGEELSYSSYNEYHNELTEFGNVPYEKFSYPYCKQCGWNTDDKEL